MTATDDDTTPAFRHVGQLRYAIVDALAPLATALTVAALTGMPAAAWLISTAAGVAVAGRRMVPYAREAADHRASR